MTLKELVRRAGVGYGKDAMLPQLTEHVHDDGTPLSAEEYETAKLGDTLGRFIVCELHDVYDPDVSDDMQLEAGAQAMESAIRQMQNVVGALDSL
jgi:hypothetical protein